LVRIPGSGVVQVEAHHFGHSGTHQVRTARLPTSTKFPLQSAYPYYFVPDKSGLDVACRHRDSDGIIGRASNRRDRQCAPTRTPAERANDKVIHDLMDGGPFHPPISLDIDRDT
jgi:hypothetical protein